MEKILISACLMGQKVRYDGGSSRSQSVHLARWRSEGRLLAVCPEVVGGLAVPRPAAEIVGGDGEDVLDGKARLWTKAGREVTQEFLAGAQRTLAMAKKQGVVMAILKARSPSCGSAEIYDGSFGGTLREGMGVTAALLRREGIEVFSDEELERAVRFWEQRRG